MKANLMNKYLNIPFDKLFETVFDTDGSLKGSCPKPARSALIIRLEKFYRHDGFGSVYTGAVNEFDCFILGSFILSHGYNA